MSKNDSFEEIFGDIFPSVFPDQQTPKPGVSAVRAAVRENGEQGTIAQDDLDQLLHVKKEFVEQRERLRKLTEGALVYATILSVFTPAASDNKAFVPGERVEVASGPSKGKRGTVVVVAQDAVVDLGEASPSRFPDTSVLAHIHPRRAIILADGKKFEVACPEDLAVSPGDVVTITRDTLQIVGLVTQPLRESGSIVVLTKVLDATTSEVLLDGNPAVVYNGKCSRLEGGVRVVLDPSRQIIVTNLGAPDFESFKGPTKPVEWDEIGGQEEAKEALKDAIESPVTDAEYFRHYNEEPLSGVLLVGPPGCGKTLLAKAAATALARAHNCSLADVGFFYIKGPEFLSKFVGVAEADIRNLFAFAKKFREKHGYKPVICIDEAEALLSKRGGGISSDIEKTVVPTFLAEMDGANECPAFLMLCTNRPDVLDPAITREGRMDRTVNITRPNRGVSKGIFAIHLRKVPLHGMTLEGIAQAAADTLFSPEYALYEVSVGPESDKPEKNDTTIFFCLGGLASGAMIHNIVRQASSMARRRDKANKTKTGVAVDDLKSAIADTFEQKKLLNHSDDLEMFLEDFKDRYRGIKKLKQSAA